jgi:putative Mn2+ efflux pump MntP
MVKKITLWEIIMIGIGLSMDAAAVSMTNSMACRHTTKSKLLAMPLLFGVFQAIMPFVGYYAGGLFSEFLNKYSGIIVLLILGGIGGKMIYDGFYSDVVDTCTKDSLTYRMLFVQAIATSIDAFAVGVGFSALKLHIIPAVLIIGATTIICSFIAIRIGKRFGDLLDNKAEILGGVILIIIGIKALF